LPKSIQKLNLNLEFTTNCYYQHIPPFSIKLQNSFNNNRNLNSVLKLDLQFPYDNLTKVVFPKKTPLIYSFRP
jgi:hypothetical protein